MGEETKVKEVEPLAILKSPRLIILWIIILLVFIPYQAFRLYGCYGNGEPFIYLVLLLTAIIGIASKKFKLTPQEATIAFAIATVVADISIYTAFYICPLMGIPFINLYGGPNLDKVKDWIPSWMLIPKEVLEPARNGGASLPFGPFLPVLAFLTIFLVSLKLLQLATAGIIARQWIEVERLPFPAFMPSLYVIKYYSEEVGKKPKLLTLKGNSAYWLGFVIGFVVNAIAIMEVFSEIVTGKVYIQLPASTGFIGQFVVDLRFLEPYLPGAMLYWYPGLDFGFFPVALFLPLDAMATAILWFFLWYIFYPAIVNILGIYPTKVTAGQLGNGAVGPWPFRWVGLIAVPFGLGLYALVFNWRYFKDYLTKAFKRTELNPSLPETLPVYTGIVAFILMVALLAAIGMPVVLAIIWMIAVIIFWLGMARVAGEYFTQPLDWRGFINGFMGFSQTIMGWPNPYPSKEAWGTIMSMRLTNNVVEREVDSCWGFLGWYRVARDTNTSWKALYIAQLIAVIIGVILAWPAVYGLAYYKGIEVSWSGYVTRVFIRYGARRFVDYGLAGTVNAIGTWNMFRVGWFFGGIIMVFAIIWLRLRFPWFFINPVGLLWQHPWWLGATMLAFVIKYVVIKVGGAEAYEKYLIPFAVGWAFGGAIGTLVTYWPENISRAFFNRVFAWFWW
ncbi:MAG: hypothetical protein DRJ52_04250 [Thermoprotei archaeon]|nr:MAG: hypothetical protein DRJ52_04250 [Thermoprotei archaeon]RLF00812.1 MAG: hypothetical protein DRJ63_01505 [Thermoprotei archaeon]